MWVKFYHVRCLVLALIVMKSSIFRSEIPCSQEKVNQNFRENFLLYLLLISCSAYSFTLKLEAACSSETSVDFQRITRRYVPEDGSLCHKKVFTESLPNNDRKDTLNRDLALSEIGQTHIQTLGTPLRSAHMPIYTTSFHKDWSRHSKIYKGKELENTQTTWRSHKLTSVM
jgi:hypothetical protein